MTEKRGQDHDRIEETGDSHTTDRIKRDSNGVPLPDNRMLALCIHLEIDECPYRIRRECSVLGYGGRELKVAWYCKLEQDLLKDVVKLTREDYERVIKAMPFTWLQEIYAKRVQEVEDWMKTERGW